MRFATVVRFSIGRGAFGNPRGTVAWRVPVALALVAAALVGDRSAMAQPYARFAVPDSVLPLAIKASGSRYETAWNALLIAELRATLTRADSTARLLTLARRVAAAELSALGSRIAAEALRLRARWTPAQRRLRIAAAVDESLGAVARAARDFDRADSLLRAALPVYQRLGERRRPAWAWGTLGGVAYDRGDMVAADSLYRQALAARRAIGDLRMVGNALNTLGSVAYNQSRLEDAWRFYQEARAVREQTGDRSALGATLGFLGNVAREWGRPDTAAVYFGAALGLVSSQSDSSRTYEVVQNYAFALANGARPALALPYYERALAIASELGSAGGIANSLSGIGDVRRRQGHYAEAVRRFEASREAALDAGDPELLRRGLVNLGQTLMNLGDVAAARPPFERALALAESLGNRQFEGQALNNLSILAGLEDDSRGAERLATRALAAAAASGDSVLVHGVTTNLGSLAASRGDLAAAGAWFGRAAAAATQEGQRVEGLHNLGFVAALQGRLDEAERRFNEVLALARQADASDQEWNALLGLGDVAERRGDYATALAFDRQAAEMIEGLRSGQGVERASVALLSGRLFAFEALIHLLTRLQPRYPDSAYAAEAFHWSERARARALLDLVAASGGEGRQARPLTLPEAQGLIRSDKEALLAYSVGDSSTSLWVLRRRSWKHIVLPPRRALKTRVGILRNSLADPTRADGQAARAAARSLYRAIVEPALPMLRGIDHLIVAPDGILALLPFEALLALDVRDGDPPPRGAYLVERYSISYAPSASALAARVGRTGTSGIVALGNPTFAMDESVTTAGASSGEPRLAPLPHTADEIAVLSTLAGPRPFAALTGRDATRDRLLALPSLSRAALIHIATHGEANEVEPERSGLWLAAAGPDSIPGFVSVPDILELRLEADLVTLSACETGLGRLERGEGVIGLARAFLAAGARTVMVSFWKVNDRSTALLMQEFYRGLLRDDVTAAFALARAKRALLAREGTRSPFYWAPFVVVGSAGRLGG